MIRGHPRSHRGPSIINSAVIDLRNCLGVGADSCHWLAVISPGGVHPGVWGRPRTGTPAENTYLLGNSSKSSFISPRGGIYQRRRGGNSATQKGMGNYISCASSTVPSNAVKVILMNGTVQEFQRRMKAAELMLENAQQFVCHSSALHIGRRITPLPADEDLEMGHLYFLLPMHKLHSVLSGSEMASLAFKANSAIKQNSKNTAQILPVFGDLRPLPQQRKGDGDEDLCCEFDEVSSEKLAAVPRLNLEDLPDLQMALAKHRANICRSWKPKLETINESRPKLRELMQIST